MGIPKRKEDNDGDVVDASKYQQHKLADIDALIDASLSNQLTRRGNTSPPRSRLWNLATLLVIGTSFLAVSVAAYFLMLHVQKRIDTLGDNMSYEQLVEMGRTITTQSAHLLYISVASFSFGLLFLSAAMFLAILRSLKL